MVKAEDMVDTEVHSPLDASGLTDCMVDEDALDAAASVAKSVVSHEDLSAHITAIRKLWCAHTDADAIAAELLDHYRIVLRDPA